MGSFPASTRKLLSSQWTTAINTTKRFSRRGVLINLPCAELGIAALKINNPEKRTAVEMYPGMGVWSTALACAGFKRVLAIEAMNSLQGPLKQTAALSEGIIEIVTADPYVWETYSNLKDPSWLGEPQEDSWEHVHPDLFYTGTIPATGKGELLLAQLYGCIFNRAAMFQFGRVPMAVWCSATTINKIMAVPGNMSRCKLTLVAEACTTSEVVLEARTSDFYPQYEYQLLKITPLSTPVVKAPWDTFEYVIRHLMVAKKQKLSKIIKGLGPGAEIILTRIDFDPDTIIGEMTLSQFDAVALRFDEWPLKPLDLIEDIYTVELANRSQKRR
ncbi:ribosomal RNA adenine dimethylase-domain-containing protein [Endogone sp. FLAS-F59071]|nr:ribosomal RNA adenine dimethylase-domain-containing protein [Endogone sp. FLAS-F59071]|eukprot:RUS17377.1 ribosomal RNA adenine dimethylase-domain-containing protein [Endogone sp. FLAS-F59071]